MQIKVLGTGCSRCTKLFELVQEVVRENTISADVIKVTDLNEIMEFGVMMTPALVIDGTVKAAGRLPSKGEILGWIGK